MKENMILPPWRKIINGNKAKAGINLKLIIKRNFFLYISDYFFNAFIYTLNI